MTRTASARLVGHNYRHIGVTFGKPWERIDTANPYVGRHRARAKCICWRFGDTGGYLIADLGCPFHGVNGSDPGDGWWGEDAAVSSA